MLCLPEASDIKLLIMTQKYPKLADHPHYTQPFEDLMVYEGSEPNLATITAPDVWQLLSVPQWRTMSSNAHFRAPQFIL